jgi:hypothetical protein
MDKRKTPARPSAASYLERGNEWLVKGELDRAISDYDLAIAFDGSAARDRACKSSARNRALPKVLDPRQ